VPELPEVETIRRQLAPLVGGRVVTRLQISDPRWCLPLAPEAVVDAVQGRRVERLGRRGKYLVWELEDEAFLLMHLRMTGTLLYDPPRGTPYERVRWELDDGHALRFCDPRRFGTGELALGTASRDAFFDARLGLEPLDGELTGEALRGMARGRSAPVKAFLLDQRRIAGVGNIYADEALFRARVHPLRPAGRLTRAQWDALAQAVREALAAGLAAGGATIDDFRHADGVRGSFQDEFLVHRRRGEPCPRCGTAVVKFVAAGRGTYACESCQPRPRAVRRPAR
jgi:formamidopyrimidine-DNA glycosylase